MSLTEEIRRSPPLLHGAGDAYFGLAWPALIWLERHLTPGLTTLETGCGGSSIVFAAAEFIPLPSDLALAGQWQPTPLDVVLIDGAHGFPYPTLDWFYTAPHVKAGGHVVVDDAFLPSVNSLVRFLRADQHWEQVAAPSYRTVVFRKAAEGISFDWVGTQHDRRPRFDYLPPGRRLVAHIRQLLFDRSSVGRQAVRLMRGRGPGD